MKLDSTTYNLIISGIIIMFIFANQDWIQNKVRLHMYKRYIKRNDKNFRKYINKKINSINDVIDIIELYYKDNVDKIKYEKKVLYTKVNSKHRLDASNYLVIIITILITVLTGYYSLVGSLSISNLFNKAEIVNSYDVKIKDELNSSVKNDDKLKTLYNDREKAMESFSKQQEVLKSDFSMKNDLFLIAIHLITFIFNFAIIQIMINYLHDAENSLQMLSLLVAEDIEKKQELIEQAAERENVIDLIDKALDNVLEIGNDYLKNTDLFLKDLENKYKLNLEVQRLKSIKIKDK